MKPTRARTERLDAPQHLRRRRINTVAGGPSLGAGSPPQTPAQSFPWIVSRSSWSRIASGAWTAMRSIGVQMTVEYPTHGPVRLGHAAHELELLCRWGPIRPRKGIPSEHTGALKIGQGGGWERRRMSRVAGATSSRDPAQGQVEVLCLWDFQLEQSGHESPANLSSRSRA